MLPLILIVDDEEEILDFLGYKNLDINYLINNAINLVKHKK